MSAEPRELSAGLHLAPGFGLPLDVAGEAIGILATRGAGKSYASAALIEELYAAGVQVCVLDPTGVYWGLRAGADGKASGLPITVLGGAHGDVPLEAAAGALIADVLVDSGQSLILDFSDFPTKGAQTRFVTDFAERLFRRKARSRGTLHLVVDEADDFAPQRTVGNLEPRMLGAMEALVRRGRSRGIGVTLITQRSAALNKNVLDLIDTLVALRVLGPRDRKAIEGWVGYKGEDGSDVIESLPSLPTGTAWVWSPVRDLLAKIAVRRIATFDSYATPKPGTTARAEPGTLAAIDVAALGEQMAAAADRAKASDPAALQRTIAELRRQVASRSAAEPQVVERVVEVAHVPPELAEQIAGLEASVADLLERLRHALAAAEDAAKAATLARRIGEQVGGTFHRGEPVLARKLSPEAAAVAATSDRIAAIPRQPRAEFHTREAAEGVELGDGGQRRLFDAIAFRHPAGVATGALARLAGVSHKSSTTREYLSRMRRGGLIEVVDGRWRLTPAGEDVAGHDPAAPATTEEVLERWRDKLGKGGERAMFDALVAAYPDDVTYEALCEAAGFSTSSSTPREYASRLRRFGIAEGTGRAMRASAELFPTGAPI